MSRSIWQEKRAKQIRYARREPTRTVLYRVLYQYREEFEQRYEELFESSYGILRREVLDAFDAYLNCGIILHGCARARCESCDHSILIPFSCKRRNLCPSCDTKRALIFAEHLEENILLKAPHRHLVFSLPKRIRTFFKFDRRLNKYLYQAVWQSWTELVQESLPFGQTGMVMSLHTAGDLLPFHPHIHAIALNGSVLDDGAFRVLPEVDTEKLEALFARKVLAALRAKDLLNDYDLVNLASWQHSGFNVYAREPIEPEEKDSRLFLARYLKKPAIANSRLELVNEALAPTIRIHRKLDDGLDYRDLSPLEFLAELSLQIPNIWEQTTRYYGCYAARTRGAKRQKQDKTEITGCENYLPQALEEPKKPVSKFWAIWIKRVFEVDPLVCPKCGSQMKIVTFIHDSKEIARITKNLGINAWRAPPPIKPQKSNIVSFEPAFD